MGGITILVMKLLSPAPKQKADLTHTHTHTHTYTHTHTHTHRGMTEIRALKEIFCYIHDLKMIFSIKCEHLTLSVYLSEIIGKHALLAHFTHISSGTVDKIFRGDQLLPR